MKVKVDDMSMTIIYCLDDDKSSRELIAYGAGNCGMKCRGFSNSAAFFHEISEHIPDIILLDIQLEKEDGLSVLRQLRANPQTASIPVMVVSAKAEEYDKVVALDSGADDYVTKPFGMLELIARIRAVMRRFSDPGKNALCVGELVLNRNSHRVFLEKEEIFLTNREYQLLEYLMENTGVLLDREHLLHYVWGFEFQAETRTVDVHIRYLRRKLGKHADLIETVRGVGYRIGRSYEK